MSAKNRSIFGTIIWYASGSSIKDLAKSHSDYSEYIGIGGLNILSTILVGLISSWSSSKFFTSETMFLHIGIGLIASFLVFSVNLQSIKGLILIDNIEKNKRSLFNLFPLYLFALIVGVIITIPLKFYIFSVAYISKEHNLIVALSDLDKITDDSATAKLISWAVTLCLILLILSPTMIKYFAIRSSHQKETSSILNEFMWFCSGANKDIVRKCPNEHSKYFGIGGTILFTALMASLSGGYAITTVFNNVTAGIYFGLFWGLLIFNLDRFIVNTMYSDGKHTISWDELLGGLPRLIIAIFLGIVISYPIELKIFETEINYSMKKMAIERGAGIGTAVDNTVIALTKQNTSLSNQISEYKTQISQLKAEINSYTPKTLRRNRIVNNETVYYSIANPNYITFKKQRELQISNKLKILEPLELQNSEITSEVTKGTIANNTKKVEIANDLEGLKGLSTRMEAFSKLKEDQKSTEIASIFIMLLFVIIEISPVLFKMMLSAGDYDLILITEKDKIRAHETEKLSKLNDWANTEILKVVEENKMKVLQKQIELEAEFKANEVLLNAIAQAQVELAQQAITIWKENELKKIQVDPNYFIKGVVK